MENECSLKMDKKILSSLRFLFFVSSLQFFCMTLTGSYGTRKTKSKIKKIGLTVIVYAAKGLQYLSTLELVGTRWDSFESEIQK